MKSNYKTLGNFIEAVNRRNVDAKVTDLRGLSLTKEFRSSTSNIVGTDITTYKIMHRYDFAANFMGLGVLVDKAAIVLKMDETPNIVSGAYPVFKVQDVNKLHPEYLMMWLIRSEFDRFCVFKSDRGIRGGFDWNDLLETKLPIPHIDKQKEIVKEYNVIQNRIALNQQLIQKLEETAQAVYRQWFVEGIDLENLPEGWRKSKIGDEVETLGGGTPSTEIEEYWKDGDILGYSPTDITNNNSVFIFQSANRITKTGLSKSSAKIFPANSLMMTSRATVGKLAINATEATTNQGFITLIPTSELHVLYLYCWLNTQIEEIINLASGSTFLEISKSDFRNLDVIIPEKTINDKFRKTVEPVYDLIKTKTKENQKLTELKDLLLSRLATILRNH